MSNRDHRTASGNAGHIGLNDGLRFVIQRTGCFIQNQHFRI
ncbi:Uncharacterised protein [Vibrio cholerae]|nr:Uncharacterised protein [Vibrio cholerae]